MQIARIINASAGDAWKLLIDTQRWPEWGLSITEVECSTQFIDANSRGRVRTRIGLWLRFKIVNFEEGRAWSWRVAGIPATDHRVEALGPHHCRVVFDIPMLMWPYIALGYVALRRLARALEGPRPELSARLRPSRR